MNQPTSPLTGHYFRRHDCICRLPHQRNTFLNMPVVQEEGNPAAWVSVDECQARLIEPQFLDLYRNLEARVITKTQVNNYTIIRDMQATIKEVTAKKAEVIYEKPDPAVIKFLTAVIVVGAMALVSIWCYMYL